MNKTFTILEAISYGWNTFKSNWKFWVMVWLLVSLGSFSSSNFSGSSDDFDMFGGNDESAIELTDSTMPMEDMGILESLEELGDLENKKFLDSGVLGDSTVPEESRTFLPGIIAGAGVLAIIGLAFALLSILVKTIFTMGHLNLVIDAARGKELYYKTLLNQVSLKKAYRFLIASFLSGLIVFLGFLFFLIPGIYFALKYIFVPFVIVDQDTSPREALKISGELTKGIKLELFGLGMSFLGLALVGLLALGVGVIVVGIVGSLSLAYVYNKVAGSSTPVETTASLT
jgi:hypothetical protein